MVKKLTILFVALFTLGLFQSLAMAERQMVLHVDYLDTKDGEVAAIVQDRVTEKVVAKGASHSGNTTDHEQKKKEALKNALESSNDEFVRNYKF